MDGIALTKQARSLWAKTGGGEQSNLWEPLYVHMLDSAALATVIWDEWLPESVRDLVLTRTDLEEADARALVSFIVGTHDIGKATPNFQAKVPDRADAVVARGLAIPDKKQMSNAHSFSHAFMGQLILRDWLESRGWDEPAARACASVVGGHHGANPSEQALMSIEHDSRLHPDYYMGAEAWKDVRGELLDLVIGFSGVRERESVLGICKVPTLVQVLLTGLAIMADWISSNVDYFPLVESIGSSDEAATRARAGWCRLALPRPERFSPFPGDADALFRRRFPSLPADARLRPVQAEAVRAAGSLSTPGMIIIEAPMGCGKTEASLLCAEVLANRFDEGGLAYLLPTQATSNAMYTRVESWLEGVHADDDPDSPQDIHLLHGKAALNEDWSSRLRWNGSWMGDGRHADDAVIAHQWFGGRKRGLLAPFVVGTVDQLLFMALNAKHVHLRHLGLAGKVVVIDEIHAYDAYMNVYLDRALAFLGKYRVPVVLLSATLPPARREQLVQAYRGIDRRNSRRRKPLPPAPRTSSGAPCYPLVTCSAADRKEDPVYLPCDSDTRNTEFAVEYLPDDDDSLVKLIRESLVDGGCICVLRNTVGRAQKAFRLLSSELDANVKLVHSRFIASDRVRNDEALLEALGPDSSHRPHSLVVVGTQVIEQSLDIDFDMIVTDIAPIDLLLQRMGRVHRHQRGAHESERPASLRNARCVITGIEAWEGDLPRFERGTAFVYRPAVLMRTVLALREEKSGGTCRISLPGDIAPLVEAVYDEDGERLAIPDDWEADYAEAKGKWSAERLEKERRAASWLLKNPGRVELVGWMDNKTGLDDEAKGVAKVRDSQESIEVTVVVGNEAGYELLPWVAREQGVDASLGTGAEVPDDSVAHAAALCTVSLPPMMSMPYCSDAVIDALERAGHYEEWQQSRWLKGALPLVLDERGDAAIAITIGNKTERKEVFKLHYSRTEGLSCVKEEGES